MTSKNEEEGEEELAKTTTSSWDKYRIATYEKIENFSKVVRWYLVLAHACQLNKTRSSIIGSIKAHVPMLTMAMMHFQNKAFWAPLGLANCRE